MLYLYLNVMKFNEWTPFDASKYPHNSMEERHAELIDFTIKTKNNR